MARRLGQQRQEGEVQSVVNVIADCVFFLLVCPLGACGRFCLSSTVSSVEVVEMAPPKWSVRAVFVLLFLLDPAATSASSSSSLARSCSSEIGN